MTVSKLILFFIIYLGINSPAVPAGDPQSLDLSQETSNSGVIEPIHGSQNALTLRECIQEALTSNAQLESERLRRGELRGQMVQARSTGLPTLDISGNWSRGRDPSYSFNSAFGGGGDDSGDSGGSIGGECACVDTFLSGLSLIPAASDIQAQTFWRASLNGHWELRPGLISNAIGAAGLGIKRQEHLITDIENRTVESVMIGYYGVIKAGEQVDALDAELAVRREFLDITRRRFTLELATSLDTLRAAVSYANLLPSKRSAEQGLRDAGARLNVLMGRHPLSPLAITADVPLELEPLDDSMAEAGIHQRSDIHQMEYLKKMIQKNRGAQKAEHRPYLSADASYGYVTSQFGELTDKGHDFWSASITLIVPFFDGMLTRGKVQETEASIRRTQREIDNAKSQAYLEILTILGNLESARANHGAAKLNVAAAEEALRQMTLRFEVGKADYISVLESQSARFEARSQYISANNEVLTLTASLKRAMGYPPETPLAEIKQILAVEKP
ncbi:MAG: TolC family protein [Candidatus Eisenbacteria bacterium]|nr:TolC family protein [Candidatus Eisenbacteria bacterium]